METKPSYYVHPSSIVDTTDIGPNTTIWAFVHVLNNVAIGANCNICDHCFIEGGVVIGNNVTLKSGIYLWTGVSIEDDAFLGPNVVFTNDVRPRSKQYPSEFLSTLICKGASIGANSTVLAGVRIGRYAMSGVGSVITRSVPDHALVYGNPARQHGWVDKQGNKLVSHGQGQWYSEKGELYIETDSGLVSSADIIDK